MTEEKKVTLEQLHKHLAVSLFNKVWDFMDKGEWTVEEQDEMLNSAHASRFHWAQIGTELNLARGDWQISRVYSLLKRPESALYHATRSLDICEKNSFGDFDLAFAFEAVARALALTNDAKKDGFVKKANDAALKIAKDEDKEYFLSELKTVS